MSKKSLLVLPVLLAFFGVLGLPLWAAPDVSFSDIDEHWAKGSIEGLASLGIINGYPDGSFKPENAVTRAEFVKMLVEAEEGELDKTKPPFVDTKEHWVTTQGYLGTAIWWNLVKPEDYPGQIFDPDRNITREEIAILLVRAINKEEEAQKYASAPLSFKDNDQISETARGYIYVAAQKKLIDGYPDQTFKPQRTATRAEAVTMLLRRLDAAPTIGCFKHH